VEDLSGAEYMSYDARGNLTGRIKRLVTVEGSWDFVTRMRYDSMERLRAITYADGTEVEYHYNAQSLLERIPGFVEGIDYLASGQYATIRTADGVTTEHRYDIRQRMTELKTSHSNGQILQAWGYTFDGVSNITRINDLRTGLTAATDESRTFVLDDLYRLTRAHYTGNAEQIDYAYDAIGNLVRQSGNVAALNLGDLHYGQEGRGGPHALTQVGDVVWTYDANGNLARKPGFTFGWDSLDRLTSVSAPNGVQQSHLFDHSGMRVVKHLTTPAGVATILYPDKAVEVRGDQLYKYIFAGDRRVAEVRTTFAADSLIQGFENAASAQHQPSELGATSDNSADGYIASPATTTIMPSGMTITAEFRLLLPDVAYQPDVPTLEEQILLYHGDHLGSASIVTDEQGQVVERISYYPYGLERARQQLRQVDVPVAYRFTGQELEQEIGLYDYGARFYDPQVGRFISVDPLYLTQPEKGLKRSQQLNPYAYALDNPLRFTDPDGRWFVDKLIQLALTPTNNSQPSQPLPSEDKPAAKGWEVMVDLSNKELTIVDKNGKTVGKYPAANNTDSKSNGPWPAGTYNYERSTTHKDDAKNSAYGSHGNFIFTVPGRTDMGIHSGREEKEDGRKRKGPEHATFGCIRTTDAATAVLRDFVDKGDTTGRITVIPEQ
jgi:RHS repeat-associated protein